DLVPRVRQEDLPPVGGAAAEARPGREALPHAREDAPLAPTPAREEKPCRECGGRAVRGEEREAERGPPEDRSPGRGRGRRGLAFHGDGLVERILGRRRRAGNARRPGWGPPPLDAAGGSSRRRPFPFTPLEIFLRLGHGRAFEEVVFKRDARCR